MNITEKSGRMSEMCRISVPMILSSSCDTVMIFTDRLFLSQLSVHHMNAAMGGGLASFTLKAFIIGLVGYVSALIAQHYGAKKYDACMMILVQGLIVALISYPLFLALIPAANTIFNGMGIDPRQLMLQKEYFNFIMYGCVLNMLAFVMSNFYSGIGLTRVILTASMLAMSLNIGCNYLLIFGKFGFPALGIQGAAIAFHIGMLAGLTFYCVYLLKNPRFSHFVAHLKFRFHPELLRKLWRFGYPSGLTMFLNTIGFYIILMMFHAKGAETATAITIAMNWNMVALVPMVGVQIGVTTLVGQYLGGKSVATARLCVKSGMILCSIYTAVIFVLFAFFPEPLIHVFAKNESPEMMASALPVAVNILQITSLYILVEAIGIVYNAALRGGGDTFYAMVISVSTHWILVPIVYVCLNVMNLGPLVAWGWVVGIFFLFTLMFYVRYKTGQWERIAVVGD